MAKWGELKCPNCEDLDAAFMNLHREYERRGDTIAELEAKLAKAVAALSYYANHEILFLYDDASFARDTIAELTSSEAATKEGGKDE